MFYSRRNISNPNFLNYTIKFEESVNPCWVINLRYLDKNLIRILSPDINPDSSLVFENMNYLRKEDISVLDGILSDLSVDASSKSQKDVPVIIYPDSARSSFKFKLNKIENVYKFIDRMSKNFIRENLDIWMDNWVLEYSDLSYLYQNKSWRLLLLSKWKIENTTTIFDAVLSPLSSPPVNLEESRSLKKFSTKTLCKKLCLWTYCELDLLIFVCFSYLNTMK